MAGVLIKMGYLDIETNTLRMLAKTAVVLLQIKEQQRLLENH